MDSGKSSDPYVVVELSGQRKKTWPKMKTTNPEWNEVMEFNVSKDDRMNGELALQCFDKDLIGEDDNMGSFIIKVNQVTLLRLFPCVDTVICSCRSPSPIGSGRRLMTLRSFQGRSR